MSDKTNQYDIHKITSNIDVDKIFNPFIYIYIQGVTGGMCETSGVFLRSNYTDITQNTYIQS